MHEGSRKAIVAAFAANTAIAASKFVGFLFTGSAGLLAEAVHSLADTGNQGLLMLGNKRAAQDANDEHPFGYGRERYFWAFVVSVVLFTLGGAFAIYEGIHKLRQPHETDHVPLAVALLAVAVLMESFSLRTAVREVGTERGDQSWFAFVRSSKAPELPVVLLEDFGALIGLALALAGVILASVTGNPWFDAAGSLAIGILLCGLALVLAREMKGLLIGEAARPETVAAIGAAMTGHPLVANLIHLRTEHIGPDDLLVAAKLEFVGNLTVPQLAAAIDAVEVAVRAIVPEARMLFIEPDVRRGGPA